jgi:hypothetical protein
MRRRALRKEADGLVMYRWFGLVNSLDDVFWSGEGFMLGFGLLDCVASSALLLDTFYIWAFWRFWVGSGISVFATAYLESVDFGRKKWM